MADDKGKQDNRDRSRVAGDEDYEIQYLAEKTGITSARARELIKLGHQPAHAAELREAVRQAAEERRG